MNLELERILRFYRRRGLMLIASYVPGAEIIADEPSRRLATTWQFPLATWVYRALVARLCPHTPPTFDLFASFMTAKTERYASLQPDPKAVWINCMAQPWHLQPDKVWYAFPPPNQLERVLNKTLESHQTLLLVAPAWPHLKLIKVAELLLLPPVLFPFCQETVKDPHPDLRPKLQVQVREKWLMAGYLISGDTAKVKAYRPGLKSSMRRSLTPTRALLDGCPQNGITIAKASEWILRLIQMI